jgi:hypothetical protein
MWGSFLMEEKMRDRKHWHVVEEKIWEGGAYRTSTTWHPMNLTDEQAEELERRWAQRRLLEATLTLNEVAPILSKTKLIGG